MSTITLTDRAAQHVRRFLERQDHSVGLRVAVKPTGCSGYQYVVEVADQTTDKDTLLESQGVNIVIDAGSLPFLRGTELDYVREGLNEGFRFSNPNVADTCGCGESFSLRTEDQVSPDQNSES